MRPALVVLSLALLVAGARTAQGAEPEDDGPYAATSETDTLQVGPSQVQATVCIPDAPGPRPVMALATNTTDGTAALATWCLHLASDGFVVAVPSLGYVNTDAASIGQTLLDTLTFLEREDVRTGSRFLGRIDGAHRGVLGLGSGAMGALWAASQDDTLSAAILLDPDDINGQGRTAASSVRDVPVLMINADPGVCDGNDSALGIYQALSGPRGTAHVDYASACDGEWPAVQTCETACGDSHDYAAQYVRRLATSDAEFFVGCEASLAPEVTGAALQTLVSNRVVDDVDEQSLPETCGPYAVLDAGAPDAGPSPTGCEASPHASISTWAWLLLAALAVTRIRRRT